MSHAGRMGVKECGCRRGVTRSQPIFQQVFMAYRQVRAQVAHHLGEEASFDMLDLSHFSETLLETAGDKLKLRVALSLNRQTEFFSKSHSTYPPSCFSRPLIRRRTLPPKLPLTRTPHQPSTETPSAPQPGIEGFRSAPLFLLGKCSPRR